MPDKKYLSKIVKGGNTLWLKDSEARELIADIQSSITGSMHFLGTSSTAISDGLEMVDSNPGTGQIVEVTIAGVKYRKAAPASGDDWVQLKSGDVATYKPSGADHELEFVYNDVTHKWQEYGSTGALKALAFKDNASATYTPAGTNGSSTVTFAEGAGSNFVTGFNDDAVAPSLGDATTGTFVTGFAVSPVLPTLGEATTGSFVTGYNNDAVAPSLGEATTGTFVTGYNNDAVAPSLGDATTGNFATEGETSSYDEDEETLTFSDATTSAAVTAQGTFSAGSAATLATSSAVTAQGTFSAGSAATLATGSAVTAQGTFSQGTAPTLATDSAVTAQGTFSPGSAATPTTAKALTAAVTGTAAAQTFSGTEATITVS